MSSRWTRVDALVATLRTRWDRGRYLRDYASGTGWQPITLPVKAPNANELLHDFDAVMQWAARFRRDSHTAGGRPRFAVETRTIQSRGVGANEVPARIRLDTFEQLYSLLGTKDDVLALDAIIGQTADKAPALLAWVEREPLAAISLRENWERLLDTVDWITARDTSQFYLRHIDVAGVDTKFVEHHQKVLGRLLTVTLPGERIDLSQSSFARRFGFRGKPDYTRLRLLTPFALVPPGITELRLRTDELSAIDFGVATVFVVENEVSYLAFPEVPDAIVIFGEGFHVSSLDAVAWLHGKEIVYWGDIDTHGFAILNRFRERFGSVRSILMDHATLLAHPDQRVTEPSPTSEPLPYLTEAERSIYDDLIEDRFGPAVRLEQERIRFSLLKQALRPWMTSAAPPGSGPRN